MTREKGMPRTPSCAQGLFTSDRFGGVMPKGKPKRSPSPENEAPTPSAGTRFDELFSEVVQASFATLSSVSRVEKRPWGALADAPEEWEVFDAIFSELHEESGYSDEVSREIIERHRARLSKLKERVYMGLFGGEGAGVATLVPRARLAYVAEVGTRPKFRRRGVARALVEEGSNLGQQLGIPYAGLTTAGGKDPAGALSAGLRYQAA